MNRIAYWQATFHSFRATQFTCVRWTLTFNFADLFRQKSHTVTLVSRSKIDIFQTKDGISSLLSFCHLFRLKFLALTSRWSFFASLSCLWKYLADQTAGRGPPRELPPVPWEAMPWQSPFDWRSPRLRFHLTDLAISLLYYYRRFRRRCHCYHTQYISLYLQDNFRDYDFMLFCENRRYGLCEEKEGACKNI